MKIQVDLDEALWAEFKAKVNDSGKTLREVVPAIFEPAMRTYINPSPDFTEPTPEPEPVFPPKRCDLCDKMVERRFFYADKRICYSCWKETLTAPVQ